MEYPLEVEDFLGGSQEEMITSVKNADFLLLPAGNDPESVKIGGDVENWVRNFAGQKIEIFDFPEMEHGWVPRGNVSIPDVERDVKLAMERTADFFKEHM